MDNQTTQQPQQQPPVQAAPPVQQPAAPVGGKKEALSATPTGEWVSQSTPEVVLPKEVENAGVESHPATPSVLPSAQQAGVQVAKEATPVMPVKEEPLGMKTPHSVLSQLKAAHKSVKDSFSWLVRLIIKEQDKKEKGASL